MTVWYKNWEQNNWLTKTKTPVLNKDLIQEIIYKYIKFFPKQIIFEHIPAHTKKPELDESDQISVQNYLNWYGNNQADILSNNYIR